VLGLLAVGSLILANAFFVAGEFALVASDRERVTRLAEEGNRKAASTLKGLRTLSFQLSGAQLGITVSSLILGFVAEPTIAVVIEPIVAALGVPESSSLGVSITIALATATAAQMVIGELIPKNLAIARPLPVAFAVVTPLRICNAIFKPIIVFLNASANWTVRRLGIEPRDELVGVRSLQEIELLIRSSREGGALLEEEYSLLNRSIAFGEKTVADALVPRTAVVALQVDSTLSELTRLAVETGHSRFPVYGEDLDDIRGLIHVKDCYRWPVAEREKISVAQAMQPALVVPESRELDDLLLEMRRERKQVAVVADEYGGTAGIVTLEDILEEIVGEIEDEYDASATVYTAGVPAGVHVVSGLLHPDEMKSECGFEIPEGPYDTLGGFLFSRFNRLPTQGEHISFEGWEFKVVAMDGHRIDRVLVVEPDGKRAQ
jgi:CBS domain containing-hemolysin-like protein